MKNIRLVPFVCFSYFEKNIMRIIKNALMFYRIHYIWYGVAMAEWSWRRTYNPFVPNVVGSSPTTGQILRCKFVAIVPYWSARCQYTVTECEIGIGTCLISHVWRHIKNCQESNITKKHKNICDVELGYLLSLPLGKALI